MDESEDLKKEGKGETKMENEVPVSIIEKKEVRYRLFFLVSSFFHPPPPPPLVLFFFFFFLVILL